MQKIIALASSYAPIAILALILLVIILIFWIFFLHLGLRRLRRRNAEIFAGSNAKNLEDVIINHSKSLRLFDKDIQELYIISNQINQLAHRSIHKIGMVRFNPFKDIGGDQSFSIALLNGKKDGLVISSLYNAREGSKVYAKTILGGKAEKYQLTEEEKEAVSIANSSETKKI